ncbi:helix-turn-helix domain-containing protein [Sphingomonas sp. TREG-RG-20F-R18-01]|uniref:helix-turn-helix domain-containing protein n=1 Tax=Sphingomonas sp. TREG-RG-20F-R18-01 TaxID=2914982 RepID=UPI003221DD93
MSLSPAEAAKHVGLTKQSVIKAIRSGRLSAIKDASGGWLIEPVELFRVWPAVNQDRGKVTPQVDAGIPPENSEVVTLLKEQIDLLRSQLDDVRADREDIRADRNHWRQIAERGLLTDQRTPPARTPDAASEMTESVGPTLPPSTGGFWSRLFGRQGDSPSEQ